MTDAATAISIEHVRTEFGEQVVHKDVSFSVKLGTIVSLIGASGTGKTTLLQEIIGLFPPNSGRIELLGTDVWASSELELSKIRKRFGVLFQQGALFSTLTVADNIAIPFHEQLSITPKEEREIIALKLAMVGLSPDVMTKMPSELSGGMIKRVALARALALEPEVLFLDEPTSGLDPIGARAFDELIRTFCDSLGLTVFMVTHDLDSICSISDQVVALGDGVVISDGSVRSTLNSEHDWIQDYFKTKKVVG